MARESLQSIFLLSPLSLRFTTRISAQSGLKEKCLLCLLLLCFFLFSPLIFAQELVKKPKIGLVLSGGGAKGFAHIGVLKEIEKAGIKIDYIGGTSMGAVIGGLYASGYSANQLDSIFKETNFDELLQDFVPRNNKTFYEKHNNEMYAISLPFQKFKVSVPKGISKGIYNYNLITRLTHNVRYIRDFSKLKIPFLCVATNIETGEEKIFKEGSLPQVLIASSAFPSLFSPVEIEGKLYVDGGVSNNYPIEEVRKMGADIIIGVDVQDDLKDRNSLVGATGILIQISNFQMIEKMKDKRKDTDIYIKPDIEGYSVVSFDQGQEIIKKGVDAALLVKDKLDKLGTQYQSSPQKNKKADTLIVKNILINDLKNYTRSYVTGKLRFKTDEAISYDDIQNGINNLNSTQNFSSISYNFSQEAQYDNLSLELKENPVKSFLKLGVHFDNLYKSSALVNFTQKNILFTNDVSSLDVILGDNFRYNFDYYRDNGFYWSFGFKSRFNKFKKNSKTDFSGGQLLTSSNLETINIEFEDFSNQAYFQTIFVQKFLIGAGIENKYINISTNSTQNKKTFIDRSNYFNVFGFLKYDSFDDKFFPKRGWYLNGEVQSFLTSTDYNRDFAKFTTFKADVAIVRTFFKKVAIKLQTEGGFMVGKNTNRIFDFVLGGYGFNAINNFKPMYGYDFLELSGNTYLKETLSIDYQFIKKNHINAAVNFANIGSNIFDDKTWISKPQFSGYAVGYGIETLIGPIEIKQSWSPESKKNYTWFSVGFWF